MRATIAMAAALSSVSCVHFDLFTCGSDEECVLDGVHGFCEASGYCSFPDDDCPSGARYSDHAPAGLANECTDELGTSSGSASTSVESTLSSTSSSESGSESESGPIPTCEDVDGDGFGDGEACSGPDCDDDNPNAADDCVYVGLGGDDAAAGTRDDPWRTFDYAVSMLVPGSSLVVLDGAYTHDDSGMLQVYCGGPAMNGTASAPIFVRAENDRQVLLDADGIGPGLSIFGCEYWRARGFSVTTRDRSAEEGADASDTVAIGESRHIEMRQVFVTHANRYYNLKALTVGNSEDVLLEDVEVHDFFRSGFIIYISDRVTCRRCYGHSHDAADLSACPDKPACADPTDPDLVGTEACPFCSAGSPDRGDETFFVQFSNDFLCENCVSEGSYRGYHVLGGEGLDGMRGGKGIRVLQSISIGDDFGLEVRGSGEEQPPVGMVVEDFVAIEPSATGLRVVTPDGLVVRRASVLGSGADGFQLATVDDTLCTGGACSMELEALLVLDAGEDGIDVGTIGDWSMQGCNVFGSAVENYAYEEVGTDPFDDDAGNARGNRSEDAMGVGIEPDECRVYVPSDSNVAGIGGSVIDRLVDGVASGDPLWTEDGDFPCGPDPIDPSQIVGEQCPDLRDRTLVGTATCPVPPPE